MCSEFFNVRFSDGSVLNPNKPDYLWEINLGYKLLPNFAVEGGFQQFEAKDELRRRRVFDGRHHFDDRFDSNIKGYRFTWKYIYSYPITERFELNTGIGATVNRYDFKSSINRHPVVGGNVNLAPVPTLVSPASRKYTRIGGTGSVGVNYDLWQGITLGLDANFAIDSFANTTQLIGKIGYQF